MQKAGAIEQRTELLLNRQRAEPCQCRKSHWSLRPQNYLQRHSLDAAGECGPGRRGSPCRHRGHPVREQAPRLARADRRE